MTPDLIAYDLIERGKHTEALKYLNDAINSNIGDRLKLFNQRGYVYVCLGDNEKALQNFAEALKIEPKSNYALLCRAIILLGAEKLDQAIIDFNNIPDNNLLGDRYWELGKELFTKAKDYEQALFFIERLCIIERDNYNYTLSKAICLSKLLKHKDAILIYQSLIDVTNYQYLIFNNLGFVYIMDGHYDQAYHYLRKGLELYPDYAYLNSNISIVHYFKKKMDKAMFHIEHSIEKAPSNAFAYFLRSKYLQSLGRHNEATASMETANKLGLKNDFSMETGVLERTLFQSL